MIAFFPEIYPDELFVSILIRFHVKSGHTNWSDTTTMLFNKNTRMVSADLPSNLSEFYDNIKHFNIKSLEKLISENTMFHYFTNYMPSLMKEHVLQKMLANNNIASIHNTTGIMASCVKSPKNLLFCEECNNENLNRYGETYWSISHQLPSSIVCIKHSIPLLKSETLYRYEGNVYDIKNNINTVNSNPDYKRNEISILRTIAEASVLLSKRDYNFHLLDLRGDYFNCLKERGYTKGEYIDQQKLAENFKGFYGEKILSALQSNIELNAEGCWLKQITQKHRKVFHPVRHLLLTTFFKHTKVSKIKGILINKFYPCLNKTCDNFKQDSIKKFKFYKNKKKETLGKFFCSCGHVYTKNFNSNKVKIIDYGPNWTKEIKKLIDDKGYSFRQVALEMNVDTKTVIKYYNNSKTLVLQQSNKVNRGRWNKLINTYPNHTKSQLRKIDPALYMKLYRSDNEWLNQNPPRFEYKKKIATRVNWENRDTEIAAEVQIAVNQILEQPKPIRISVRKIGTIINKLSLLEKHLDKLPKTKKIIINVNEDIETFQVRRIKYVIRLLIESGENITSWKIQRAVGIKYMTPKLQQIVNHTLKKEHNLASIFPDTL